MDKWWVADAVFLIESATRSHDMGGSALAVVQAWENLRSEAIAAQRNGYSVIRADEAGTQDDKVESSTVDTLTAAVTLLLPSVGDGSMSEDHTTRMYYSAVLALHTCGAHTAAANLTAQRRAQLTSTGTFAGWARLAVLVGELHEVIPLQRDTDDLISGLMVTTVDPPDHPWQREVLHDLCIIARVLSQPKLWQSAAAYRAFYRSVSALIGPDVYIAHVHMVSAQITIQSQGGGGR